MPALPENFPIRNRIIAALGCACLVIQAAPRSGSLSTARQALELGARRVGAAGTDLRSPFDRSQPTHPRRREPGARSRARPRLVAARGQGRARADRHAGGRPPRRSARRPATAPARRHRRVASRAGCSSCSRSAIPPPSRSWRAARDRPSIACWPRSSISRSKAASGASRDPATSGERRWPAYNPRRAPSVDPRHRRRPRGQRVRLAARQPRQRGGAPRDAAARHRRPRTRTDRLAELVCSNSLRSDDPVHAAGLLKREMEALGSLVIGAARAERCRPAARSRSIATASPRAVTDAPGERIPRSSCGARRCVELPDGDVVLATGPLTSPALSRRLGELLGADHLYFYDAIAPIVEAASLDLVAAVRGLALRQGRRRRLPQRADGPRASTWPSTRRVLEAEVLPLHDFEQALFFEGCLPIEELARRGVDTLRFGPMKPVGLTPAGRRAARTRSSSCGRRTWRRASTTWSASSRA